MHKKLKIKNFWKHYKFFFFEKIIEGAPFAPPVPTALQIKGRHNSFTLQRGRSNVQINAKLHMLKSFISLEMQGITNLKGKITTEFPNNKVLK